MKLLFPSKNRSKLHYLQLKVEKNFRGGIPPDPPREWGGEATPRSRVRKKNLTLWDDSNLASLQYWALGDTHKP